MWTTALTTVFVFVQTSLGYLIGYKNAQKVVSQKIHAEYKKFIDSKFSTVDAALNQALTQAQQDRAWVDFLQKDFLYFTKGSLSLKKKLTEAIVDGARLKAKNLRLERELKALHEEILSYKVKPPELKSLDDKNPIVHRGDEIKTDSNPQAESMIPHHGDLDRDTEIKRLQELMQEQEGNIRFLRAKNRQLVDLIKEFKKNSGSDSTEFDISDDHAPFPIIQNLNPPAAQHAHADSTILWQLNGQLTTVPLPKSLTEMKPWVDTYLANKVILTDRALRGAAKTKNYQDVTLVYKALLLLGTRRDMLVEGGMEHKMYFEEQLKNLRLDCETAIRPSGLGNVRGGQYYVKWGHQEFVTNMALKGSSARDPSRVFRIYFADNKPGGNIIVGHLPTHLENRLT